MRIPCLPVFCVLFLFSACRPKEPAQEASHFFPVTDYIRGQVHYVDSLGFPVSRFYTSPQGMTDSGIISQQEFSRLAQQFMSPDLNDPRIRGKYAESSFADQTIASATLTYSTRDASLPLQRLDVIIQPDPVISDKVKSIYMEKKFVQGDTAVQEKMYWRADHNFQMIEIKQAGNSKPQVSITKVIWKPE